MVSLTRDRETKIIWRPHLKLIRINVKPLSEGTLPVKGYISIRAGSFDSYQETKAAHEIDNWN